MSRLPLLWTFVLLCWSATERLAEVIDEDIHGLSPYFPEHKPYFNSSSFRNTSFNFDVNIDPSNQEAKKIRDEDVIAKVRFHIVLTNDTLQKPESKAEQGRSPPSTLSTSSELPYYPPVWTLPTTSAAIVEKEQFPSNPHKEAAAKDEFHQYYGASLEQKATTPTDPVSSSQYPVATRRSTTTAATTTSTTQPSKAAANKIVVDIPEAQYDEEERDAHRNDHKKEAKKENSQTQGERLQEVSNGRTGRLKAKFEIDHEQDMPIDEYDEWQLEVPVGKGVRDEREKMDNITTTVAPQARPQRPQASSWPDQLQPSPVRPDADFRDVLARIRFHIFRIDEILQVVPESAGGIGVVNERNQMPPARPVAEGDNQRPAFMAGASQIGSFAASLPALDEGRSSAYHQPGKHIEQKVPYVQGKPYPYLPMPVVHPAVPSARPPPQSKNEYSPPKVASQASIYSQPIILGDNDNVPSYPVQYVGSPFIFDSSAKPALQSVRPPSDNSIHIVQANSAPSPNVQQTAQSPAAHQRDALGKILAAEPYDPAAMNFYREVTNSIDYNEYEDAT